MAPLAETVIHRRVFWFLVALVVVPTLVLAFFGITGVVDQRAASEQRLRERYLLQAGAIQLGIVARLEEEDGSLRNSLLSLKEEDVARTLEQLNAVDPVLGRIWQVGDPAMPEGLAGAVAARAADLSPKTPVTFLTVEEGDVPMTVAISRVRDDLIVAYELDVRAIDALVVPELVGKYFPNEAADYHLRTGLVEISSAVSFTRLRQDLAVRLAEEEGLVDRPLNPPFGAWRLTISPTADPPGARWRTIAVLLMAGMVVAGVWTMGRAIAQQANMSRLQTDFISSVSHELKTPLTSIRMFIETLQSGRVRDPEKVQECLDIIAVESERLSRKIERVLSWARMEAGRRTYDFEILSPEEAIGETLAAFRTQQLDGGNAVEVELPKGLPLIRIDRDAFGEALLNLLSNARKYGGQNVRIRLDSWVENRFVAIRVADDGPGIPASELKRIFEKFYRPKILLSQNTQGSGLGLAIVRSVIEAHRGRVTVESVVGKGAAFTLRFPKA
jgi:signal transduction histidine kinase